MLRRFAGAQRHALVVDHDQRAVALHHRALGGEVERHDRDVLRWMYCQMSSSVQFEIGKTRIDSPGLRAL
jgi:hypothetical protein